MDEPLTKSIVFRLSKELREALERDAIANERTVAQSVRFHLRHLLPERKQS